MPAAFLQRDVRVGASRHVIMATLTMLTLLVRARTWFVDATRHVVKYIEKYLNTNTNTFQKIKYKYFQMQMYLNTNTNTFKSISNTNTFMFLYHLFS